MCVMVVAEGVVRDDLPAMEKSEVYCKQMINPDLFMTCMGVTLNTMKHQTHRKKLETCNSQQ